MSLRYSLNGLSFFEIIRSSQKSALEQDVIVIDADTKDLLKALNFDELAGVEVGQRT